MEKVVLSENELAQHWGVSPKTLQRWRTEGRGPRYLKLSKRVVYPVAEIRTFESNALYGSTSERVTSAAQPPTSHLLTAKEAILLNELPDHLTLFDLAVDPPALWDEQRARLEIV